jgi:flagellar biosynthetic protein FlhB
MAAESSQDRKLPASPRKIQKSREDGQVARSRDLSHFGAIGAGVALLAAMAMPFTDAVQRLLATGLRFDASLLADPSQMVSRLAELGLQMVWILLPLFGAVVAVAVGAGLLVGGWTSRSSRCNPSSTSSTRSRASGVCSRCTSSPTRSSPACWRW